jgi:hypothetical protein
MNATELADKLEALDVDAFAALLQLDYSHDDMPSRAKKLIIDALRFADQQGFTEPTAKLDDGD